MAPERSLSRNLAVSAGATLVAEVCTLPICTIKTNFQNGTYTSIAATAQAILRRDGLRGFYKASLPATLAQVLSTTSKYTLYQKLESVTHNTPYYNRFLNGLTAGVISSLMTHPLDIIKVHMQMNTRFLPVLQTVGPKVIYRGYSKTLGKICVSSLLFFPLYDYFKEMTGSPTVAALGSSTIACTAMQPLDYMKTRQIYGVQHQHGLQVSKYFRGLSLNLMRVIPHFVIVMCAIEQGHKLLDS